MKHLNKILIIFVILSLCVSFCITSVFAISPNEIDCKYFPFDSIPLPETFNSKYAEFNNLQLFYYDYNSGLYYATFTRSDVSLLYSVNLKYDAELQGYRSGNIYKSDEDGTAYDQVTLLYSNDTHEWSVYQYGQYYAKVSCVTVEMDLLYYGGSVNWTVEEVTPSVDEEETKKWYDYIIDALLEGMDSMLGPIWSGINDIIKVLDDTDEYLSMFENFGEIFQQWSTGFEEEWNEITEFVKNLNNDSINFVKSIWEFPIVKELTVGLVILIIVSAVFALLKSGL